MPRLPIRNDKKPPYPGVVHQVNVKNLEIPFYPGCLAQRPAACVWGFDCSHPGILRLTRYMQLSLRFFNGYLGGLRS